MKPLICEMCNGRDMVKQDGVFVCQYCGCKYSVEEARKMMYEGSVNVSGSRVKIDTTEECNNLYVLARRAKNADDGERAVKYYEMILLRDPMSWEASFYVVYYKAVNCTIAQIQPMAEVLSQCIGTTLDLINEHVEDRDEQVGAVEEILARCGTVSDMLYNGAINSYNGIERSVRERYTEECVRRCNAASDIMLILGNKIDSTFADVEQMHSVMVKAWKNGIGKYVQESPVSAERERRAKELLKLYTPEIQKVDMAWEPPKVPNGLSAAFAIVFLGALAFWLFILAELSKVL